MDDTEGIDFGEYGSAEELTKGLIDSLCKIGEEARENTQPPEGPLHEQLAWLRKELDAEFMSGDSTLLRDGWLVDSAARLAVCITQKHPDLHVDSIVELENIFALDGPVAPREAWKEGIRMRWRMLEIQLEAVELADEPMERKDLKRIRELRPHTVWKDVARLMQQEFGITKTGKAWNEWARRQEGNGT